MLRLAAVSITEIRDSKIWSHVFGWGKSVYVRVLNRFQFAFLVLYFLGVVMFSEFMVDIIIGKWSLPCRSVEGCQMRSGKISGVERDRSMAEKDRVRLSKWVISPVFRRAKFEERRKFSMTWPLGCVSVLPHI